MQKKNLKENEVSLNLGSSALNYKLWDMRPARGWMFFKECNCTYVLFIADRISRRKKNHVTVSSAFAQGKDWSHCPGASQPVLKNLHISHFITLTSLVITRNLKRRSEPGKNPQTTSVSLGTEPDIPFNISTDVFGCSVSYYYHFFCPTFLL